MRTVKWCPPLSYAWYSCTLQTVTSHDSVGPKIYCCYGQWLFPRVVDNHDASPRDLEHVTYRAKCETDQSDANFQMGQIFRVTLQMRSLPHEHIKRFCKLCLTWDEDWSPLLFHCHHTTKCFCLQREIFHYLLTFMKVSLFSKQAHNM